MEFIRYVEVKCVTISTNIKGKMEVDCYKVLIISLEMIHYHLKIDFDKLKMDTINSQVSPKITEQNYS